MGMTNAGRTWQVHCGDAKKILSQLEEETFDCVITSPPYYSLRDYGVEGQIGLEPSVIPYVSAVTGIMQEVKRVLRKTGVLFLNIGDTYYSGKGESQGVDPKSTKRRFGLRAVDKSGGLGIGIKPKSLIGVPWRVAIDMVAQGWVLRSSIIWHRKHALPEAVGDRPRRSYEYIFMFVRGRKYFFSRNALLNMDMTEDVWTISARPKNSNGLDTAPFPDEVVRRCLEMGCPPKGRVLDPFVGSGTTLRVALGAGRDAFGIDISPRFCAHIVESLEQQRLPCSLRSHK
ncbi:MAG: site-specific DNA-methyltransferase [Acidobacteria bacterium]|nr:site-specific DNA-methyltransferase [Acidobacteriota bacterium]